MTTWTQNYPSLPGSGTAAAHYAQALVSETIPERKQDAFALVEAMFQIGVTRSSVTTDLNLVSIADNLPRGRRVKFELTYANDIDTPDPPTAHQLLSRVADAYGERRAVHGGRIVYAELWAWAQADSTP